MNEKTYFAKVKSFLIYELDKLNINDNRVKITDNKEVLLWPKK